jgi:hypothetical protein
MARHVVQIRCHEPGIDVQAATEPEGVVPAGPQMERDLAEAGTIGQRRVGIEPWIDHDDAGHGGRKFSRQRADGTHGKLL